MSDPNPYEPPRVLEPLTKGQVVKRGIGFAVILLLTPVAMGVTFFVSCSVAFFTTNPLRIGQANVQDAREVAFWAITLVPTVLVAAAMLYWANRYRRRR